MNYSDSSFRSQQSLETAHMRFLALGFALVSLTLGGCAATSPPRVVYQQPLAADFEIQDYKFLDVVVDSAGHVTMASYEKERLTQKIIAKVKQLEKVRFEGFNVPDSGPDTLSLEVTVVRYDRGDAFARFMLAGLGQIHVDGEVLLREKATQRVLEKATVKKTFAWGGFYGGATTIEDVEDGFAAGVLEALGEARGETETAWNKVREHR